MWGRRQSGQTIACASLFLALMLPGSLGTSPAVAAPQQESAPVVNEPASAPVTPEAQPANALEVAVASPQDEKVDSERRRKLRIALLTGGLIAITGLALVLLTILGGSATRRGLRRKPLKDLPLPAEPIPAERFDEPEPVSTKENGAADDDHPARNGEPR
jgi:hypothetical protein